MTGDAFEEELSQVVRQAPDHLASKDEPKRCFNCAFFHTLQGERGLYWGVCFNPASYRRGLLNHELYGCHAWQLEYPPEPHEDNG